jgi:hypothetical protein
MVTVNTDNYTIGGIDLYFAASIAHASLLATGAGVSTVGSAFRVAAHNLGNIVSAEFAPNITYVEHYISRRGAKLKDAEEALQKDLTISFTFDEINEANLKKFFMASSLGNSKLAPVQEPIVYGSVSMLFRTDVGNSMVYSIPRCSIRPDGNLAMNIDDWWSGPMVIDVLNYDSWASKPYGVIELL